MLGIYDLGCDIKYIRDVEKEKEAEAKFNALKLQVQIVRDFAVQLSKLDVSFSSFFYSWLSSHI